MADNGRPTHRIVLKSKRPNDDGSSEYVTLFAGWPSDHGDWVAYRVDSRIVEARIVYRDSHGEEREAVVVPGPEGEWFVNVYEDAPRGTGRASGRGGRAQGSAKAQGGAQGGRARRPATRDPRPAPAATEGD